MKFKEFKKWLNNLPKDYDELHVINKISEGQGFCINKAMAYKNTLSFFFDYETKDGFTPEWKQRDIVEIKDTAND